MGGEERGRRGGIRMTPDANDEVVGLSIKLRSVCFSRRFYRRRRDETPREHEKLIALCFLVFSFFFTFIEIDSRLIYSG